MVCIELYILIKICFIILSPPPSPSPPLAIWPHGDIITSYWLLYGKLKILLKTLIGYRIRKVKYLESCLMKCVEQLIIMFLYLRDENVSGSLPVYST